MELTYTQCSDYLIPDLVLSDTKKYHIRKNGLAQKTFDKENKNRDSRSR